MENDLLHKVYDFFHHIIHPNDSTDSSVVKENHPQHKTCPVTQLDISMQPRNSKFLSYTGVKWYFEHDRKTYEKILEPRLTENCKRKEPIIQFKEIAHSIRNEDSNPRNNTKRAVKKLLEDKNSLFNNMQLIDKNKLREIGMV